MAREFFKVADPRTLSFAELQRIVSELNEILLHISPGLLTDGGTTEVTHSEVVSVIGDQHTQNTDTKIMDADGDTQVQVEESADEDIIRLDAGGTEIATIDSGGIKPAVGYGIADADGDTKIQVEEGSDDDTIRFDTGGTQRMSIGSGGSVTKGTGLDLCLIKTGNYTGNGAESYGITGIGFQPKFVIIWPHPTANAQNSMMFIKLDQSWSGLCIVEWGVVGTSGYGPAAYDNRILSLDSDGFTVDDQGTDAHPNTNGTTYDYIALG